MAKEGESTSPTPSGPERRLAPRLQSSLKITCYPAGAGLLERRQVRIRNVSRTGIGLSVDRLWPPGTALILELPEAQGVRMAKAKVIHSTEQFGGTYLVGCTFDLAITDAEVEALSR